MNLDAPRLTDGRALQIAGLNVRYRIGGNAGIPAQWQQFGPQMGSVPGQIGHVAYGVCSGADGGKHFDYLCGVEVEDCARITPPLTCLRLDAQRYAVFKHDGPVSSIRQTWDAVWTQGLSKAGLQPVQAPFFERYGEEFDASTGLGGLELWIAVQKR